MVGMCRCLAARSCCLLCLLCLVASSICRVAIHTRRGGDADVKPLVIQRLTLLLV